MKNKQHEHILNAFLASKIPAAVYEHAPELVAVDSVRLLYAAFAAE